MTFLKTNAKNLLLMLVLLVAGFYLYSYFFVGGDTSTEVLTVTTLSGEDTALAGDLLLVLADLRTLKLDESLFSDPVFQSLKNFRVELTPEPIGRDNPFAPLTGAGSSQNSSIQIQNFQTQ